MRFQTPDMTMTPAPAFGAAPPSTDDPRALLRQTHAADIDEHVELLHGWDLRYDQLDCGRFEGRFTDIRWPGMQLFLEKTTRRLRQRGHLMNDSIGVGTMIAAPVQAAAEAGAGSMIACHSTELDICTPPCTLAGVVVDAPMLRAAFGDEGGLDALLRPGTMRSISPTEPSMRRWRELLLGAVTTLTARPALLEDAVLRARLQQDLLDSMIYALSTVSDEDRMGGIDQRKRVVDRACDMMLSSPDDPPSLAEVCHRIGASPRKLGYCFQDVLGISPARYVKAVRLGAVRRELARCTDPAASVYDVAARWGFWHFGHFSADYRRQFDELPSETLRRGRERHAH
jgi:AraC family ethanolamine operon transcriptional activator